jgi:hypothetical protein
LLRIGPVLAQMIFFYWVIFFKAFFLIKLSYFVSFFFLLGHFFLKHLLTLILLLDYFSLSHFNDNYILPNRNWAIFVISFEFWPNKINTQYKIHSK